MKVLVATDGSDASTDAVRRGFEVLGSPDAVVLLTVLTDVPGDDAGGFESSVDTPEQQEREWADEQVDAKALLDAAAGLVPTGVTVDRRVEVGDPASAICDVAADSGADVIVVGSHGRGLIKRIVLGSVSEHVVRHAPCPVLVVRPEPDDEEQ